MRKMLKTRTNFYIKNANKDKLYDVQYVYRKRRHTKKSISEIVNRLVENLSLEHIIGLLDTKDHHPHKTPQ